MTTSTGGSTAGPARSSPARATTCRCPDNVKKHLDPEEWDYWYEGKPAAMELTDPFGTPIVPEGEIRDGGSYWKRFSNIEVWNSLMQENDYLVKRWTEFLNA